MFTIDLTGTSALVTGGSAGIGAGCIRLLQQAGARVVCLDVHQPQTCEPDAVVVGDVRDPRAQADALAALGTGRSLLVNNAALQLEKRLEETTSEEIDSILGVNVKAMIELTGKFAGQAPTGSSVVNLGSVLGVSGDPELAVYSVSKGAVINFTRTAALQYAGRYRVNAVIPGAIRTPLTTRAWDTSGDPELAERRMTAIYPVGRIGEPDDVANVVVFLASERASFMTGSLVGVDGGLLAANAEWGLGRL